MSLEYENVQTKTLLGDAFLKLKSNLELNPSFDEEVQRQHKAVRDIFDCETKLIGSLQRQTRIQPKEDDEFDIDILVVLGSLTGWVSSGGISPADALGDVRSTVSESSRYEQMRPESDAPTILFYYANGTKVELVPAYLDQIGYSSDGTSHSPKGRAYWIPHDTGRWQLADYDWDKEHVTKRNKATEGYLVPVIKMLKALKREYFSDVGSYALEMALADMIPMIIKLRQEQRLSLDYPYLVADSISIMSRVYDTDVVVDGGLSVPSRISPSLESRQAISALALRCNSALKAGTGGQAARLWREIFGQVFPAS